MTTESFAPGRVAPFEPSRLGVRAALFDMDRTLIAEHSARLFTKFRRDRGEATLWDSVDLTWMLFRYSLGLVDLNRVARRALAGHKGVAHSQMVALCDEWYASYVKKFVSIEGARVVRQHALAGHHLAIVTASTEYASRPLARDLEIPLVIASEIELDSTQNFTGDFVAPLCYGPGKVERARRCLAEWSIALDECAFYTDSITDLPLLDAVKVPVCVNPDARLRRLAKRRGWPMLRW